MDCSLPGSSVHGILQARILEWGAISSSGVIFPTWGLNLHLLHLLHWQAFFFFFFFLPLVPPGKPKKFLHLLERWLLSAKGSSVGKGAVCAVSNPPSPHPLPNSWGMELWAGNGSRWGTDHTNHALHCHLFSSRMNLYSAWIQFSLA